MSGKTAFVKNLLLGQVIQSLIFLYQPPTGRKDNHRLPEREAEGSPVNKMLFSFSVLFSVTYSALFSECLSPLRVIFLFDYLASDSLLSGRGRSPINQRPAVHMQPPSQ